MYINLTDEQIEQLKPLTEKAHANYAKGDPGALLAQVHSTDGYMSVHFIPGDEVKKAYSALGVEIQY